MSSHDIFHKYFTNVENIDKEIISKKMSSHDEPISGISIQDKQKTNWLQNQCRVREK